MLKVVVSVCFLALLLPCAQSRPAVMYMRNDIDKNQQSFRHARGIESKELCETSTAYATTDRHECIQLTSGEPAIVIFTTVFSPKTALQERILFNTIRMVLAGNDTFKMFGQHLEVVVFTDDVPLSLKLSRRFPSLNIQEIPATNPYGAALVPEMFDWVVQHYTKTPFFMFMNSDGLFDAGELLNVLIQLSDGVVKQKISHRILACGHRINVNWTITDDPFDINGAAKRGEQFLIGALDYFIFTRCAFQWHLAPKIAVGRNGVDNFLAKCAVRHPYVTFVDASNVMRYIHQSDDSGTKNRKDDQAVFDKYWNLYELDWDIDAILYGTVASAEHVLQKPQKIS